MPRNPTTGVFTRVSNSFSDPVFGTVIDPTDADALFDDYDTGLTFNDTSPLELIGSTSGVLTILAPDTASGTLTLPAGTTDFSATGGASNVVKQTSIGGAFTVAQLTPADISGAASTSTLNAIVRFSNTTGGTKDSAVTIGDTGTVTTPTSFTSTRAGAAGLQLTGATPGIEHGATGSVNSPFYDWHSSGVAANDYDLRMQVSGGVSGVNGAGSMAFYGTLAMAPPYDALLNPYQQGITIINQQGKGNAPQGPVLNDGWSANEIIFTDLGINSEAFAAGAQNTNAFHVHYRGNGSKGIGQAIVGTFLIDGVPTTTDANLNQFVAGQFIGQGNVNLGGSDTSTGARGALFGIGAGPLATSGATNLLNVTNEFNAALQTGSSSRLFSVISVAQHSTHSVSGAESDCSISISSMSSTGVNSGIEFSNPNGAHPVKTTGTLIKTRNSATVANGIDFSSYTISGDFLKSANFVVSGAGAVTTGTWSATAITAAKGGTGQTTYTKGDLLVTPGGTTINKLAVGTDGQVLTADAASTNGVKWSGSPVFTTPTLGSATATSINLATGTAAAPSLFWNSHTVTGFFEQGTNLIGWSNNGANVFQLDGNNGVLFRSDYGIGWSPSSTNITFAAADVQMFRGGVGRLNIIGGTLNLGGANAATPVSQTLQAQGSRPGTDSNVAGGNLTIQPGNGTGNSTPSALIFKAPIAVASGTGAQTQTETLRLQNTSAIVGSAAIATTATDGFLYIPSCAGTPTGVPASYTGRVPMVWDSTNKKFYIYDGGWLGGTVPGVFS